MMGLEIRHDKFHNGYVNANPTKKLPTFDLTASEVLALTLAKEMLAEYTGTPFHPILRSALEKIQERLPARVQLEVGDVEAAVEFGRMPMLPFSKKVFLDLHKACEKRLQVQLEYRSASKGELTVAVSIPLQIAGAPELVVFGGILQFAQGLSAVCVASDSAVCGGGDDV
jgi:predicted DNA-binding transcriptional regulator YafY